MCLLKVDFTNAFNEWSQEIEKDWRLSPTTIWIG